MNTQKLNKLPRNSVTTQERVRITLICPLTI